METSDFHLSSSSPAKGAGVAIRGLALDYAGRARANPPSIGAFEYTSDDKSAPVTTKKDTLIVVLWVRFLGWLRETASRCRSLVYRSVRYLWSTVKIWVHSFQHA
jgi:hypothetical protein